jgi:histidyl-tRNA synthetase
MTSSTPTSLPAKADKKAKSSDKDKAKTEDDAVDEASVGVGSIAAGGRYDNLVGMFAEAAGQKRDQVPCVGISIGVERVYSIMEMRRKNREEKIRGKETDVYVLALGGGLLKERMAFAKMLRDNGIKVGRLLAVGDFC